MQHKIKTPLATLFYIAVAFGIVSLVEVGIERLDNATDRAQIAWARGTA